MKGREVGGSGREVGGRREGGGREAGGGREVGGRWEGRKGWTRGRHDRGEAYSAERREGRVEQYVGGVSCVVCSVVCCNEVCGPKPISNIAPPPPFL